MYMQQIRRFSVHYISYCLKSLQFSLFTLDKVKERQILTGPGGSIGFSTANKADEHIIHSNIMLLNVLWFTSQWQKTRNLFYCFK